MKSNVWSAWWKPQFDPDEYLYHYTTFETALKILYSDKFKFSPLSKTNDTTEQKLRIRYAFQVPENHKEAIPKFEKYLSDWTTNSKLLCFSQDRPKTSSPRFDNPFDVSGRGFALPRMWAQYASRNCGVCLIVRKKPFEEKVIESYPEAICKKVSYFEWSDSYVVSEDFFNHVSTIVGHNPFSGYAVALLHEDSEFTEYSYFSKLKDWSGENEYRILLPDRDNGNPYLYIEGIKRHLAGIVVGECMDNSQISAIKNILSQSIPIRRIVFGLRSCSVENVSNI